MKCWRPQSCLTLQLPEPKRAAAISTETVIARTLAALVLVFLMTPIPRAQAPRPPSVDVSETLACATVSARSNAETLSGEMKLGRDYLVGNGVPRDPAQSAYWYGKAADQGDPYAQNQIGYFYISGTGVQRDPATAVKWFSRAMAGGSEPAKLNLAVMYLKGDGVSTDIGFGISLLHQLGEKGNARAEDYLGSAYFAGYGVPEDRKTAEKWFRKSARGRNPEGEFAMGTLYSVAEDHPHDYSRASKWLRSSAQAGFVPAMGSLGILLANHPELPRKQPGEAVTLLQKAAEAGSWESSVALGVIFSAGRETRQDPFAACRWFAIAVRQAGTAAVESARTNLDKCRETLNPDQLSQTTQAADAWLVQHPQEDLFVLSDGLAVPRM